MFSKFTFNIKFAVFITTFFLTSYNILAQEKNTINVPNQFNAIPIMIFKLGFSIIILLFCGLAVLIAIKLSLIAAKWLFVTFFKTIQKKQIFKTDNHYSEYNNYSKKRFFTKSEHHFFLILQHVCGKRYIVFAKTGLWNLLKHKNLKSWNRIAQKHIDFIIYDPIENNVIMTIELDGKSHKNPMAFKNDTFKNQVLEAAGIPLLRIQVQEKYDPEIIRKMISDKLKK